jgi:hypothetical protein
MCVLSPDSSCITPDILRKCALVARHESPSSSVRFKRRQSASNVDGDNAAGAPDDRANTDLVPTEPSTSGLGQLWEVGRPSRAAECQSPRGPRHDVERKLDKPKPANSGAPAAYPLCSSKQSRPIIPRTRKLKAGPISPNAPSPPKRPRSCFASIAFPLVRSFACSLVRFCLVPDAYSSPAHQKNQLALVS